MRERQTMTAPLIIAAVTMAISVALSFSAASAQDEGQGAGVVVTPQELTGGAERLDIKKETYDYTSWGKRDPFFSLVKAVAAKESEKKKAGTAVEGYDLSQMRLVAVANDEQRYYALVSLPDGKHYTILRGTPIGLHDGYVYDITAAAVIVREYMRDYKGNIKEHDSVLSLRSKEAK